MKRKNFFGKGNDAFRCEECGSFVEALSNGSFRNHCPYCLYSKHVDVVAGDRSETCRGMMQPIRAEQHSRKGWMVVHRCTVCNFERSNKVAPDDSLERLITLM